VFVCEGEHLKLGDFGIARHHVREAVPARTLNRGFAPREMLRGAVRHWRARDDVYQVGQLLGILVKGDATAPLTAGDVRRLASGDHMKEIIQRCIGTAHKRFQTAGDLMTALAAAPTRLGRAGPRISSLRDHVVVFTGRLAVQRRVAARLARRAGATVDNRVTERTTVVVRGIPSPVQRAGAVGSKLMDVAFWKERGGRIAVIGERRFWTLVGRVTSPVRRP
jgi:hypothetical protein